MKNTPMIKALYTAINHNVDMINKYRNRYINETRSLSVDKDYLDTLNITVKCLENDLSEFKVLLNKIRRGK
tara:strand:+ start:593 stop:805 length:213 start_codon:yes stop_codon:yes gene_type:complete